jgi:hypothetical protein
VSLPLSKIRCKSAGRDRVKSLPNKDFSLCPYLKIAGFKLGVAGRDKKGRL